MSYDMYLYGMILRTNSFLLEGDYPEADTYAEIRKKYSLPGGETGTCATVLLGLGRSVKMDGTFMGKSTMPFIKKFYEGAPCDLSGLHLDETFDGLEDNVLVAAIRARRSASSESFIPIPCTAGTRRRQRTSPGQRSRA